MKALRLRRKFGLYQARHEIDTEDRTNHAERIGDRVPDRRVLVFHDVERGLKRCGAGHRSRVDSKRMPEPDPEDLAEPERDEQAGDASDQRQQIVFLPDPDHAFKELAAVENADAVEEHDQAGQPDRPGDLRLWRKGADCQANEEDGAYAERESADTDLADEITKADREKRRQDRLAADDIARNVQHLPISPDPNAV